MSPSRPLFVLLHATAMAGAMTLLTVAPTALAQPAASAVPPAAPADDTAGSEKEDLSGSPAVDVPGSRPSEDIAGSEEADVELPALTVEGDRGPRGEALPRRSFEMAEDRTGFGETVEVDTAWRSFESTSEVLSRSVGAQLRRQGGRDDFSTLSIRGAPAGQLRILLDGVPLGRASDSVVNIADLPLDSVDRIEVYRGFAPVALSPASAAGVVNVITKEPTRPTASFGAGLGSFGSGKVHASASSPVGDLRWGASTPAGDTASDANGDAGSVSAFASLRTTDGDFDYVDDNGTVFNPFDDRERKRANNDSDAVDALLRWRGRIAGGLGARLRSHTFYKEEGVPGLARFSPPSARLETIREIAAAGLEAADKAWSVEQSLTWQSEELSDFGAIDNEARTTATSTTGRYGRGLGRNHWLTTSGDLTWEGFDQDLTRVAADGSEATRWTLAVAGGDEWTLEPLDTTASLQLRHQELWNDADLALPSAGDGGERSTDPRLGLSWSPRAGLALKGNVSTYFRPPTFDELYGADGFTKGNPDLVPEEGLAWDAGFEWKAPHSRFGALDLGYSWFGSEVDDVILVVLTFDRTAKAVNAAKARVRGHEVHLEWSGPLGLAVSANYTYQDAENRSPIPGLTGKQLPGLAPHEAYARASWERGRFVVAYEVDVSSEHYTDAENANPALPTRVVHGVSVVWGPFWDGFRVTVEGDNLGDTLIPDEIGFPLPGRAFYATLSWSGPASPGGGR